MAGSAEKVLVLDRGAVEFFIPGDWSVAPDPAGHLRLTDPRNDCLLEVSYVTIEPPFADAPPVDEFLRQVLKDVPHARNAAPVVSVTRGSTRLATAFYAYRSVDAEKGGPERPAVGRWMIASNGRYQVLITFYHWADDEPWAAPAFERAVESLQLGDGVALKDPSEHWALRKPS